MSKKSKKHLSSLAALAKVRTTPVTQAASTPVDRRSGLQRFTEEFNAAEKEKTEASIKAVQTEHARLLRQMIDGDVATLYVAESSFLSATAPSIGDGSQFNGIAPESIRATIRRVFSEFEDSIAADGKLTASGKQKLQNLSRANLSTDWTQASSWSQAFYLLRVAGELSTEDFIETPAAPREQPTDLLAEMEAQPDTHDGRLKARELGNFHLYGVEVRDVFIRFLDHCAATWDFYPSESQMRSAVDWFTANNRSMLSDKTAWDDMKRSLVKRGIFPRVSSTGKSLLSQDELLSERVEESSFVGAGAYNARREFAQEIQKLR